MKLPTNNYIRVGAHPQISFIFFNSQDTGSAAAIRDQVQELLEGKGASVPIGMWKPVSWLNFPVVGEILRRRRP